jgi:hypothetical protein
VLDLSTTGGPSIVGGVGTPGATRGVVVVDDRAYTAENFAGVRVIDVSAPETPVVVDSIAVDGRVNDVAVEGDIVCAVYSPGSSAGASGLAVIDVSVAGMGHVVGNVPLLQRYLAPPRYSDLTTPQLRPSTATGTNPNFWTR